MQKLNNIDSGREFDWGRVSKDYAKYRDIYPEEFYKRVIDLGLCTKGQRALDLGTGTGVIPRNMYKYGAEFVGADISAQQIDEARRLSAESGMDIEYVVASAEDIDFADNSFDAVTACQCFMYFNKEIVIPKIHRLLKDNGHFCILFMSWLPYESEIALKSEELVLKYNPVWNGASYNPDKDKQRNPELVTPDWGEGLFETANRFGYEVNLTFTRESWHGRIKACRGIGASSLSESEIAAWEKEHLAYLETVPETFTIPHWCTVMDLRKVLN